NFFSYSHGDHRDLHSFPTRRSSDLFTGYILNPSYIVKNQNGEIVAELAKNPSFFGRKFTLHKKGEIPVDQQEELLLGLFMMVLLDRKSTRLNSSHVKISYAVFCLKK